MKRFYLCSEDQARSENLAVAPVSGVSWSDLGDHARIRATRDGIGWQLATTR
jgi:hypothetical protein